MRGTHLMWIGVLSIVVVGLPQPAWAVSTPVPRHAAAFEWPHRSALAAGPGVGNYPAAQAGAPASAALAPGQRPGTIGVLPRVLVGSTPQDAVFDPATRTVYVANQGDNTMSVANARTCNARNSAGCGRQAPAFPAGSGPFGIGLDQATHTIYVADGNSDTVSVFNAATCNAAHTAGCRRMTATMKVGGGPANIAVDPATDTVYVTITGTGISGAGNTVAVINGATCNAANTSGCGHKPATVPLGTVGFFITFDSTNQTVYVTDPLTSKVSMINTRACRAGHTAGCGRTPPTVAAGNSPIPIVADPGTNTIYVGSGGEPAVTLINGATCNAATTSGCGHSPGMLHVQGGSDGLAINDLTHTLFVANNGPGNSTARSNSVSVVDAATCNALNTSGCGQRAPAVLTGANPGGPAVDQETNTLDVATFDNALQVINGATCNTRVRNGCGQTTPAGIAGPDDWAMAIDPATHTAYVGDDGQLEGNPLTVSVLNTATCNTTDLAGCTPHPTMIPMKFGPFGLAVDPGTDTLYAANTANNTQPGHTISVINGATCNATNTSGCATAPAAVTVGTAPAGEALDQATHTLYVANSGSKTVSVINTAACNAQHTAGCGHPTPRVPLGHSPWSVAVNQATDTIYVLNPPNSGKGTISVIDGATCNATDTSGCGTVPPTVTVGDDTRIAGLAVDQATDTIYAVNTGDNTVSVINGATCNATVTSGCHQTPRQVHIGREGYGFATIDPITNMVYVTNFLDDTISVIDGNSCNGHISSGCGRIPPAIPAGANPGVLALDQASHTVYVNDPGSGTASFFHFQPPQRPTSVVATAHDGKAKLRWQPPYDGGLPIIYHVIPTPACPDCRGRTTPSTSGQPFTTITGLTPGQKYTFKIKATDAAGAGPESAPSYPVVP